MVASRALTPTGPRRAPPATAAATVTRAGTAVALGLAVPAAPPPTATVLVVTRSSQASEVGRYLDEAGLPAQVAASVPAPTRLAASVTAVVVFPDDLPLAMAAMLKLRRARKALLLLLVTSHPGRYQPLTALAPDTTTLLPAPAFGWHLVDEIRRHHAAIGRSP